MTDDDTSMQGPDRICAEFEEARPKLLIRMLDHETVLVESDKLGLEFLSEIFAAVALAGDDGFQLSPNGPGQAFFTAHSGLGIYIHRASERLH